MVSKRDKRPGEFGGVPGRIAPPPHPLSAAETARLQRATDSADINNDSEDAALVREWVMEGRK